MMLNHAHLAIRSVGASVLQAADIGSDQAPESQATVTKGDQFVNEFLFIAVDVGIVLTALAIMLCFWRILKGPTLIDRGLASDTIAVQVAALVILLSIRMQTLIYFDAVLIVSILGFVSTVAFAQFIGRRRSVT